jgi:hypothetical protein
MKQHGGQPYPESIEQANDPASRYLRNLIVHTLLCMTCTVPILVLAWAPLSHSPILYGGLSVGFATIAAPMYSSTACSVLFIRQVDLNILADSLLRLRLRLWASPFRSRSLRPALSWSHWYISGGQYNAPLANLLAPPSMRCPNSKRKKFVSSRTAQFARSTLVSSTMETPSKYFHTHTEWFSMGPAMLTSRRSLARAPPPQSSQGTSSPTRSISMALSRSVRFATRVARAELPSHAPLQDLAQRLSAIILSSVVAIAWLAFQRGSWVKERPKHEAALDGLML